MFSRFINKEKRSIGRTGEKLPGRNSGPPDSTTPYGLCPRCEKQSSFDATAPVPVTFDPDTLWVSATGERGPRHVDQALVLYCRNCHQGIMVVEQECIGGVSWRAPGEKRGGNVTWSGIHWWPAAEIRISRDVPTQIAEAFKEAVRAHNAGCPRAAAVMARRTLEAVAVDKGEQRGVLAVRLNNLASKGILLPTLADWSREVRLVGNVGAHLDPIKSVSTKDSEDLISFVRELLRYLYELPADLAKRRGP